MEGRVFPKVQRCPAPLGAKSEDHFMDAGKGAGRTNGPWAVGFLARWRQFPFVRMHMRQHKNNWTPIGKNMRGTSLGKSKTKNEALPPPPPFPPFSPFLPSPRGGCSPSMGASSAMYRCQGGGPTPLDRTRPSLHPGRMAMHQGKGESPERAQTSGMANACMMHGSSPYFRPPPFFRPPQPSGACWPQCLARPFHPSAPSISMSSTAQHQH
jgi:hypothetical protein